MNVLIFHGLIIFIVGIWHVTKSGKGLGDLGCKDMGRGTQGRGTQGRGDSGMWDVGLGDVETRRCARGLYKQTTHDLCAEFVKYNFQWLSQS